MSYLYFALTPDDLALLQQSGAIEYRKTHVFGLGIMICDDCKSEIERKSTTQKLCEDCRREKNRKNSLEWKRKNRMKLCTVK